MRLGTCTKHRHGDKESETKDGRSEKTGPAAPVGVKAQRQMTVQFFRQAVWANIWCAVLAEFPGGSGRLICEFPEVSGWPGRRCCCRACRRKSDYTMLPVFWAVLCHFFGAEPGCQYLQALPQNRVFQGFSSPTGQFVQFPFRLDLDELVQNAPDFIPVAFDAVGNFRYLGDCMAFGRVSPQSLAQ